MRSILPCALAACASIAHAQPPSQAPTPLEPVIIPAPCGNKPRMTRRSPSRPSTLRESDPMVNFSEALVRVPGLLAGRRNNYAQDLQVSSRGFGARAGFGVRGLRRYTDGIPASMPDGQGPVGHFDLAGTARIEVLRGPFSVLYGNRSGGVIAAFTEPARSGRSEGALDAGSFGLRQMRTAVTAPLGGGWDMQAGASNLDIEGFGPHSGATRTLSTARLGWCGTQDRVLLLAGAQDQPADDQLGLTREQLNADPDQTTPQASPARRPRCV